MRKRKGMAVIAAIVMTAMMSVGTSLAATTTVGIKDGAAAVTVNQTVVGFAGHEWWVIGDASSGVYPKTNSVTLLAKSGGFGNTEFRKEGTSNQEGYNQFGGRWYEGTFKAYPNEYKDSTLQRKMVQIANNGVPAKERGKINKRMLSKDDDKNYPIRGEDVADQQLWPLSLDEYGAIGSQNVRSYGADNWLRSYSSFNNFTALYARAEGNSSRFELHATSTLAARPALNLNVSSVTLTSNAGQTGKAAATVNGVPISLAAPVTTGTNNKIKYTFADDSLVPGDGGLKLGNVSVSKVEANKATVKYDGATENKNLSFVVKNSKGESTHYGKLAEKINGEGEASLDITNIDLSQNTIHVFTEEINGENLSDFATTPKDLNIDSTKIKQVAVTNGNGGGSYTVGAEVKLKANAADTGKRFKHWEISPEVAPTQNTSFENETITFTMPGEDVTATAVYEYSLTVTGGSGSNYYAEGEEVTITSNPAAAGKRFKGWEISPEVTPTQGTSFENETITFTMPGEDVTATVEYEDVYTVTVNNGSISGGREYAEGEEVTLTANPAAEGQRFKGWEISPEVTLTKGSLTSEEIGFNMPKRAVTATAEYEDVYTVTVNNGSISGGIGEYAEGEEVTITANPAAAGQRFKKWEISPEVTPTQGTSFENETITFTMPGEDVTATVVYDYSLTVTGGSGSNYYTEGEEVTITANPAPEGKYFKGWSISPEVTLKDGGTVTSGIIKFDMPAHAVTATAVYEDLVVYPIKDGDNTGWTQGDEDGLIITSVGEHRKFTGVTVDGNTVDSQHYTVESGSTIVTLKASYLSTLSVGEHVMRIHFTDGYTETKFNVQEVQTDKPTPPTTDPDNPNPPVNPGEPTSPVNPPVNPNEPTSPNPPVQGGTTAATTVSNVGTSPKTEDSSRILIMVIVMLGAGFGFMVINVMKQHKSHNK